MLKIRSFFIGTLITNFMHASFSMEAVTELNEPASPDTMQQQTLEVGLFSTLPLEINASIIQHLSLKDCLPLRETAKFFSQFISFIQVPSKTGNNIKEALNWLNNNPYTVSVKFSNIIFSEWMDFTPVLKKLSYLNLININHLELPINSLPLWNKLNYQILEKSCEIEEPSKQFSGLLKKIFKHKENVLDLLFEKDTSSNKGFFKLLISHQSVDSPTKIKFITSEWTCNFKMEVTRQGSIKMLEELTNLSPDEIDTRIETMHSSGIIYSFEVNVRS